MRAALLALAAASALGACRRDAPGDPPRYAAGRSSCARCGMAVSEARFAAGWVGADGESVLFDDAGEFLASAAAEPGRLAVSWVGDFETGEWTRAGAASFVRVPGLATPMGTGVVAFAARDRAAAFARARPGGEVLAVPVVR
ncbi:MAG: nitrous oxide reductase accessory protein NosL [Elusimicrobia bacterium]|nr:nitrous oxide reductase accessory protein NosL [Elusimicrobiota bacterium]